MRERLASKKTRTRERGVRDRIPRLGFCNTQGQRVKKKFLATLGHESRSQPLNNKRLGAVQKV